MGKFRYSLSLDSGGILKLPRTYPDHMGLEEEKRRELFDGIRRLIQMNGGRNYRVLYDGSAAGQKNLIFRYFCKFILERQRCNMQYISHYKSPLGELLMAGDDAGLTGLWFEGQKYFARCLDKEHEEREIPLFETAKHWLDVYFSGKEPDFSVPLHFIGTEFQKEVWKMLCSIPYGQTTTYGSIVQQLAARKGLPHMSAQAVGGAVGHNEISIIVPCHRVVGKNGSLTGYAGGIERKKSLLMMEGANMDSLFIPQK